MANELNRLHNIFIGRNPNFTGQVYLGGHSLGSVIMTDLLSHQPRPDSDPDADPDQIVGQEATESTNEPEVKNIIKVLVYFISHH